MMKITDDGYLDLEIQYADGSEKTFRVDVFDLYNRLVDGCRDIDSTGGSWAAYNERRQQVLAELGYGELSTAAVVKIGNALVAFVDATKKNEPSNVSAATPNSTASPSSPSAPLATRPD